MKRLLFTPCLNRVDQLGVIAGATLLGMGDWGNALMVWAGCAAVSLGGQLSLAMDIEDGK